MKSKGTPDFQAPPPIPTVVDAGERTLSITLTKKMGEDLSASPHEIGVSAGYHTDITTIERVPILCCLRTCDFDVLMGK
jgi:excinuclease UvrABC helicase subunit UvrB